MRTDWQSKKIGDVIKLEYGKPLPKEDRCDDGLHPIYGANGQIGRTNKFYYDKPSIIVGRKGSAGEINLSEEKFWPLDVTYFVTFDETENDLQFINYLLQLLKLPSLAKGVKPGINRNDVYSINAYFPPLPEQKRIVALLDEAFAGISQAVVNAEKNLANARELFESYLNDVFTRKGEGWAEKTLGDICQFENGDRGKNYPNRNEYVESGIPWINTGHIQPDGTLSKNTMNYITQEKFDSLRSGKIQAGDLVYCLRGATLGKTALVDPFATGAVASSLVIIRPSSALIQRFLYYFLTSTVGQKYIKLYDNGAAQPNLGAKSVAKYQMFVPDVGEQERVVQDLDKLALQVQLLEAIYDQKLAALAELKQSILQKAFAGELTADAPKEPVN